MNTERTYIGWFNGTHWLRFVLQGSFAWAVILTIAVAVARGVPTVTVAARAVGMAVGILGAFTGTVQWTILEPQVRRAGWWVLASTLGAVFGFALGFIVADAISVSGGALLGFALDRFMEDDLSASWSAYPYVIMVVPGVVAGTMYGAITGLVLFLLLRHPRPVE